MNILNVRIDNFSKKEILERIENFLNEEKFHQIATVNPEFILQAQHDSEFKDILNGTDLNVADGIGIKYAFLRFGKFLKQRLAGVDLLHEILEIANKKKLTVFLAIRKDGLSSFDEIRDILNKTYPNLKIIGDSYDLSHQSSVISHQDDNEKDDQLQITDDCILFCNFGAPDQEKFIFNQKSAKIRLAMGVGGAFDFITKKAIRAPRIMQYFGLEWLWRLIQEPRYRFRRILNAVIIFPIKILFNK
jgi:N-acetylglucosaminyldiphosphoundecaprenol N-acetyl-beta-D-mannosaminyltransferase